MYIQYIFVKDLFLIEGTEERIFIPHVLCLHSELFSVCVGFYFRGVLHETDEKRWFLFKF